jgi:hypothetical protein
VRTLRADCLDRIFILGRRHLEHVLQVYRRHYNEHRPHRALHLLPPNRATQCCRTQPLPTSAVAAYSADSSTNTRSLNLRTLSPQRVGQAPVRDAMIGREEVPVLSEDESPI